MTAGYSVVTALDAERRFPRSWAKVDQAEDFLRTGRHFACRHVMNGAGAVLCTDHLPLGLLCTPCMEHQHLPRHSDEAERTCDECAQVVDLLRAIMCAGLVTGVRIREPRGRRRIFAGPVSFIAVGCCAGCWSPA